MIGDYLADFLVEGILIVELKAAKTLAPEHEAQVLGYLKSARIQHGLPINFGSYKFEVRKYIWTEKTRVAAKTIENEPTANTLDYE
jgi:GxxExxY protein